MKFSIVFIISLNFLVGCSSLRSSTIVPLSFKNIQNFQAGKTTSIEIEKKLGTPAKKELNQEEEKWTYLESSDGGQRLTLVFAKNKILDSSLWIPRSHEPEKSMKYIKELFPTSKFKSIKSGPENPHTSFSVISYLDENLGISLMTETDGVIEAVAFFDPKSKRETASQVQSPGATFSIGK